MNNIERNNFWKILLSLDGRDVDADIRKLDASIIYPQKLYRYRSVSIRSLDALRSNKLYFSTANYYDDPFDTFINVRIKEIRQRLSDFRDIDETKTGEYAVGLMRQLGVNNYENKTPFEIGLKAKEMAKSVGTAVAIENYFRNIRNEIKKDTFSVCFSESPLNETLWIKYAEQHKGFAVEYDLSDDKKLLCGKQEKCKNCGLNKVSTPLYPVYYTDEKYDATRFAQFLTACKLLGANMNNECPKILEKVFGTQAWERERITLIKKSCHRYDEEWRMLITSSVQGTVVREWVPSAVYLGLNMEPCERDLVTSIARSAGVDEIFQCIITDEGDLGAVKVYGERNER